MKVRPKLVLNAERIETEEQARQATILPLEIEIATDTWAGFIGDWLITHPNGSKFIRRDETFADDYEVLPETPV